MKSEKRKVSRKVYIQAAEQISIQSPLSEEWMNAPISYEEPLVKAVNPSFRDYLAPNEARRMGNLMKRALVTSLKVLKDTGIEHPDAIITGTCLGSLDYTVRILDDLVENGEETVSPTYFMQSTHNTVGFTQRPMAIIRPTLMEAPVLIQPCWMPGCSFVWVKSKRP